MNLRGWDYTGRNVSKDLHSQFRRMVDCLSDKSFVKHRTWGNPIQDDLAASLGVSSSGAIRTIKKIFEDFGFINPDALNSRTEIDSRKILTKRGQMIYYLSKLEKSIDESSTLSEEDRKESEIRIKGMYEEAYCDVLKEYYYVNEDGSRLMPLRATIRAIERYGRLDKWEWYLMNTIIRHDDNANEEALLDEYINKYRNEAIHFNMSNVVEKPKGHQYIPQYFEFAGLCKVVQRPDWSISLSGKHSEVVEEIMSSDYLDKLYQGGAQ